MAPIVTSTEIDCPATEVFDYATDPTRFNQWQNGVINGIWTTPELRTSVPAA
jgi:uncharacterized protein YndB with AHSA1/START domain